MADLTFSILTLEYVKVPVQALKSGVPYDPTGDPVQMAFMPLGAEPSSGDWKTASWETANAGQANVIHYARCLVGPSGDATPTVGQWVVWVKISDTPEVPVLQCGTLRVV